MSSQHQSTLTLPGELLNMVLAYLPPESIISLALTCRALHKQLLPSPPAALSKPARATLISWLEKDNPLLYWLCYDCHEPDDNLHGQLHTRPCGFAANLHFPLCPVKYQRYPELVAERIYGDHGAPGWFERLPGLCEVPEFLRAEPRRIQLPSCTLSGKEKELVRREFARALQYDDERRELQRRQQLGIEALRIVIDRLGELGLFPGRQLRPGVLMLLSRVHSGAALARRGRDFGSGAPHL